MGLRHPRGPVTQSLRAIRPGAGLPPKYLERALGAHLARDAARGTPLSWDLLIPKSGAK